MQDVENQQKNHDAETKMEHSVSDKLLSGVDPSDDQDNDRVKTGEKKKKRSKSKR